MYMNIPMQAINKITESL